MAMLSLIASDNRMLSLAPGIREHFRETAAALIRAGSGTKDVTVSDESEYRLLDTQYVYDAEHFPDPGRAIAVGSSPALSLLLFARELTGKPRCSLHSAIVPSGCED